MRMLRKTIRNCPPPLELADDGHFVQEAGAVIVERALAIATKANSVYSVAFSPDGTTLAVGGREVRIPFLSSGTLHPALL